MITSAISQNMRNKIALIRVPARPCVTLVSSQVSVQIVTFSLKKFTVGRLALNAVRQTGLHIILKLF